MHERVCDKDQQHLHHIVQPVVMLNMGWAVHACNEARVFCLSLNLLPLRHVVWHPVSCPVWYNSIIMLKCHVWLQESCDSLILLTSVWASVYEIQAEGFVSCSTRWRAWLPVHRKTALRHVAEVARPGHCRGGSGHC